MENRAGQKIIHMLEVLSLATLLVLFGRVAYAKFYHPPAEALDAGADPRLMVVDLVSVQQLAESTGVAHRIQFDVAPDGSISGYRISYRAPFGEPWAALRSRSFPPRVRVSSPQAAIDFAADGNLVGACEVNFDQGGRRRQITMTPGTGELRLVDATPARR